jgi:hypothetical protein
METTQTDTEALREDLRRAFTPSAVIDALDKIGVRSEDLSLATGVDARTVRRWGGENEPRPGARDALDRLRIVVLYLLQRNALASESISSWLKSRSLELGPDPELGVRRPVDSIREGDLASVFAAINALIGSPTTGASDMNGEGPPVSHTELATSDT